MACGRCNRRRRGPGRGAWLRADVAPYLTVGFALATALSACATSRETSPPRTATEQLLISAAADRAAERLTLRIPSGAKVFVDASYVEGLDSKYAISAVRDRLLNLGAKLVAERPEADMVVELRVGALSVDEGQMLIGIPQYDVPIPLTGAVSLPEIALFKRGERKGVAKIAATGYSTEDGSLIDSSGVRFGFSHETEWVVLLFFSWTTSDLIPREEQESSFGIEAPTLP